MAQFLTFNVGEDSFFIHDADGGGAFDTVFPLPADIAGHLGGNAPCNPRSLIDTTSVVPYPTQPTAVGLFNNVR